jgi:uncharacterized protein (TIGR02266 family)
MKSRYLLQHVKELQRLEKKARSQNANYTQKDEERRLELTQYLQQKLKIPHEKALDDKRYTLRIPVDIKLTYKNAQDFNRGYAKNMSGGGLYFEDPKSIPLGTKLLLTLYIEDSKSSFHIEGEVVWESSKPNFRTHQTVYKHGIKFCHLDPETQAMIDRMLEDAADNRLEKLNERINPKQKNSLA